MLQTFSRLPRKLLLGEGSAEKSPTHGRTTLGILLALTAVFVAPGAVAAEGLDSGNTAWVLTSTALVLFMTIPGLSLFYGGLVRGKNVLSVLMQCFSLTCLMSILWMVVGYSLAFDDQGYGIVGGLGKFFMAGVGEDSLRRTGATSRTFVTRSRGYGRFRLL